MAYGYGTRSYYETRYGALKTERDSGWAAEWRDLIEFVMPRLSRFSISSTNRNDRRNSKINDGTGTYALRTLASGMMAARTSPARPWLLLRAPDPALNELQPVKVWLDIVRDRMMELFTRSNLYSTLPLVYTDLGLLGTSAFAFLDDYEDMIRAYHFPIGSYCLATSERGVVDVCYREFQMTVRQLAERFGEENLSVTVKKILAQKSGTGLESWIPVLHGMEPNPEYDPRQQQFSKFKRFNSCYLEFGAAGDKKLKESGFDRMRILAPRWMVTGEDVYGTSPGMDVKGDVRGLQFQNKRKQMLIDKGVMPPLGAPAGMKEGRITQLPGDVTFYDQGMGGQKVEPLLDVSRFPYQWLLEDIQQHRDRINEGFFKTLFLMFSQDTRAQPPTAREVAERHEEKLFALGPVVVRQNDDMLDPMVDITFEAMIQNNALPEPPRELQGQPLRVEYTDILTQAMKLVGVSSVERGASFIGGLAGIKPEAADMVDTYETVAGYWDIIGAPPKMLRDKKFFEQMQEKKLQQSQAAQMGAMLPIAADAAKTMSETPADGNTALTQVARRLQGG